jgi:hypothetical protein
MGDHLTPHIASPLAWIIKARLRSPHACVYIQITLGHSSCQSLITKTEAASETPNFYSILMSMADYRRRLHCIPLP